MNATETASAPASARNSSSDNEAVAKAAASALEKLSKYELRVYDHPHPHKQGYVLGPMYQDLILDYLESWPDKRLADNKKEVCILCQGMLSSTIEGNEWTYNSLIIKSRPVSASGPVRDIRDRMLDGFVDQVAPADWESWTSRIVKYASVKSDDLATFPKFGEFLQKVSARNPQLGLIWLRLHADALNGFIPGILDGLLSSDNKAESLELINQWICEGKFLAQIARIAQFRHDMCEAFISPVAMAAIKQGDNLALRQVLMTLTSGYSMERRGLVEAVLPSVLDKLYELKDYTAPACIWYLKEREDFMAHMSSVNAQKILDMLLSASAIRHEAEEIVTSLAIPYPQLVLDFLAARIRNEDADKTHKYDAVPYQFYSLHKVLIKRIDLCVATVRGLYSGNYGMFVYRGGRLIRSIFDKFEDALSDQLLNFVKSDDEEDICFVLAILKSYDGDPAILKVCKAIVEALPENHKLLGEILCVLAATGVVTGEYGMAEAYEAKNNQIQSWVNDPNTKVAKFAEEYSEYLTSGAQNARKRADEEIRLRKFEFGAGGDEG